MAEPLIDRQSSRPVRFEPAVEARPAPGAPPAASALSSALVSLDQANRRLSGGGAAAADDALRLLHEAALHLERAVAPRRGE